MKLKELQQAAEKLLPEEQRKLVAHLVAMDIQRDETYRQELKRRLDDPSPEGWVSLKEGIHRLKNGI